MSAGRDDTLGRRDRRFATRLRHVALAAALVAWPLWACGPGAGEPPAPASAPPNVLLVVFDTTRFDDWSIFDPERGLTPNLDRLAAGGQRFANAYSLYSVTVPSHVSLFTGSTTTPPANHLVAADLERAGRAAGAPSSLFAALREHGYRTYAVSGNDVLRPERLAALDAVDRFADDPPYERVEGLYRRRMQHYGTSRTGAEITTGAMLYALRRNRRILGRSADWVTDAAAQLLDEHAREFPERPFLLFVNYNDAHDPYQPEPPWDERVASDSSGVFQGDLFDVAQRREPTDLRGVLLSMSSDGLAPADIERARALHLGSLAFADHHFGRLLAHLEASGELQRTLVVATADHGEAFGEGGRMAHGGLGDETVAEALLHVPLLFHLPGAGPAPRTHDVRVDLRDVKPTVLDILGIEDDGSQGRSLLPSMRGMRDALRSAAERPQDRSPESVGDNLIPGQDEETTRQLEQGLRELGYIE